MRWLRPMTSVLNISTACTVLNDLLDMVCVVVRTLGNDVSRAVVQNGMNDMLPEPTELYIDVSPFP